MRIAGKKKNIRILGYMPKRAWSRKKSEWRSNPQKISLIKKLGKMFNLFINEK